MSNSELKEQIKAANLRVRELMKQRKELQRLIKAKKEEKKLREDLQFHSFLLDSLPEEIQKLEAELAAE